MWILLKRTKYLVALWSWSFRGEDNGDYNYLMPIFNILKLIHRLFEDNDGINGSNKKKNYASNH